jgi:hypothetical protein
VPRGQFARKDLIEGQYPLSHCECFLAAKLLSEFVLVNLDKFIKCFICNSHVSVDEASKTVTVHYLGGMFPNQAGTEGKRTVSVSGNELKVSNPATASGMKSESVYRRAITVASR